MNCFVAFFCYSVFVHNKTPVIAAGSNTRLRVIIASMTLEYSSFLQNIYHPYQVYFANEKRIETNPLTLQFCCGNTAAFAAIELNESLLFHEIWKIS